MLIFVWLSVLRYNEYVPLCFCHKPVSRKQSMFCFGSWKNLYHCKSAELQWRYNNWRNVEINLHVNRVFDSININCNDILREFNSKFENLKTQFISRVQKQTLNHSEISWVVFVALYDTLCSGCHTGLKNPGKTKPGESTNRQSGLSQVMSPVYLNFQLSNVK